MQTHHNKYLNKYVESAFEKADPTYEEVIGYRRAKSQSIEHLKDSYDEDVYKWLSDKFEVMEEIKVKGVKRRANFNAYQVRFDRLYRHYQDWCKSQKLPYLFEDEFWKELISIFPHITMDIQWIELNKLDKKGHPLIDEKGNIITYKFKARTIIGISFVPEGIRTETLH